VRACGSERGYSRRLLTSENNTKNWLFVTAELLAMRDLPSRKGPDNISR